MKKILVIVSIITILVSISYSQQDTTFYSRGEELKARVRASSGVIFGEYIVKYNKAALMLYNIGRLIFYEEYPNNQFVIAVTNQKVYTEFLKYFGDVSTGNVKRTIHGRPVKIVVITKNNLTDIKANLIYVSHTEYDLLPALKAYFLTRPTVIVSEENKVGLSYADIGLTKIKIDTLSYENEDNDDNYTYGLEINDIGLLNSVRAKRIFIMPELLGYNRYYSRYLEEFKYEED